MPDFNISTNMNLPIPVPTVAPGPQYAINEQSCFNLIDTHNHTSGQGVPIPAAALNIDGNLPMNGNTLESCAGVVLENQSTTPATNTIYSVGGNLYYQNGLNQVQITSGSSVNAAAGNITGLASPASVTWSAGTVSYIFKSTATNYADLDLRNVLLRNTGASTYKMTVSPPSAMASDYTVTLPTPPASTSFMTMDSSGTVGVSIPTSLGIQTANIADLAITTAKIDNLAVTTAKIAANSVGTSQLIDGAVTAIKKSDTNYATANLSNYSSGGPADIGSVSLTTTAANSALLVTCNGRSLPFSGTVDGSATSYAAIILTGPGGYSQALYLTSLIFSGCSAMFLTAAAGTYTATVRVFSATVGASVNNMLVRIVEIR